MKPAPFTYAAPHSLDEAVEELRRSDGEAKLLAGGQSLIPLLNMRLARPSRLVDLARVPGLATIRERDGGVAIGAMVRDRAVERDERIAARVPLLAEAIRHVGHAQIRNRGTVVGSLTHADPSAEMPAVAVCLDARLTVRGSAGTRELPIGDLYLGYMATSLAPDEIVAEVWFPSRPVATGHAWLEFSRRHGDFAIVGVGVVLSLDGENVGEARVVFAGVGGAPVRPTAAERLLAGQPLDESRIEACAEAASADLEPDADIHATAEYRRHLAGVLLRRALRLAHARARADAPAALDVRRSLEIMGRNA